MRLAVGRPLFGHGLGRNLARALELHVAMIARRQRAHFVDDVHQHLGAEGRQALTGDGIVGQHFLGRRRRLHEGLRILDGAGPLGTAHRHRLEVLRTHHGAHA